MPSDAHLPALLKEFKVQPCRVLEIGCGSGSNLVWLSTLGFECTGIDVASAALRLARDRERTAAVSCSWLRGSFPDDFWDGPLPRDGFEFIFDRGVFDQVTAPAQQRRFLRLIERLLSPQGIYYTRVARKETHDLPGGGPRWTAAQIRRSVRPVLKTIVVRAVPRDSGEHGSGADWACIIRRHGYEGWRSLIRLRFGR